MVAAAQGNNGLGSLYVYYCSYGVCGDLQQHITCSDKQVSHSQHDYVYNPCLTTCLPLPPGLHEERLWRQRAFSVGHRNVPRRRGPVWIWGLYIYLRADCELSRHGRSVDLLHSPHLQPYCSTYCTAHLQPYCSTYKPYR